MGTQKGRKDCVLFWCPSGHLHAVSVYDPALATALIGQEMPLSPDDFTGSIGGVPAYAVNAVVIALNDAYNQSAGQQ